jgi:TRAP-type transport system periplasmic protein
MRKFTILGVSAIVAGAMLSLGAGSVQSAEKIRIGHDQQKSHAYQAAATTFATKLMEATNGAYDVKVFPGAQLGHEMAMLDNVIAGNLNFSIAAASNASTFLPFLGMFSVSYLFEDVEHFKRTLSDDTFAAIVDKKIAEADVGFKRVAWFTAGVRNVYNNKKPIMAIDDIKDIKLRVMASPIESKVWGSVGAKPMAIPFGDVYTGMQTGLVDAAENAAAVYGANKHNEVAPFYSLTGHQWLIACLYVSDKTWAKLPVDVQAKVMEIGKSLTGPIVDHAVKGDAEFLEVMKTKYGVKVNDVDKSGFIKALSPLQDEVAKELKMEAALARIRELR